MLSYARCNSRWSLKSIPPDHPYLGITYRNIAHVYEQQCNYRRALIFYEKTNDIYNKSYTSKSNRNKRRYSTN